MVVVVGAAVVVVLGVLKKMTVTGRGVLAFMNLSVVADGRPKWERARAALSWEAKDCCFTDDFEDRE